MTGLAEVCGDLAYWLPRAAQLVAEHDTTASSGRAQPASKPPWNPDAATAVYDALEAIRRAEQDIRTQVTGRMAPRRPHARIGDILDTIPRLAEALDDHGISHATTLKRRLNAICALNAIGETEPWRRIIGAHCPYCGHHTLLAALRDFRVTCPRWGECFDSNGRHPVGVLDRGAASAMPVIAWADGRTQHPSAA